MLSEIQGSADLARANRSRLNHRLFRSVSEGTGEQKRQMRTTSSAWRRRCSSFDQLSGISVRDWVRRLETQHLGVCLLWKRLSAGSEIAGVQRYTPRILLGLGGHDRLVVACHRGLLVVGGGVNVLLNHPNGRVPEESRKRWQVDVLLRDSGRKGMAEVVGDKADCDPLLGGLRNKPVVRRVNPADGLPVSPLGRKDPWRFIVHPAPENCTGFSGHIEYPLRCRRLSLANMDQATVHIDVQFCKSRNFLRAHTLVYHQAPHVVQVWILRGPIEVIHLFCRSQHMHPDRVRIRWN